jgi:hypothetical protein
LELIIGSNGATWEFRCSNGDRAAAICGCSYPLDAATSAIEAAFLERVFSRGVFIFEKAPADDTSPVYYLRRYPVHLGSASVRASGVSASMLVITFQAI